MEELKNKPLVEAIVELRWGPARADLSAALPQPDLDYQRLLFSFRDKVREKYPYHEPLPAASLPPELNRQIVQHRFRVARDAWPLVQFGPGIMAFNDTEGYKWESFETRCVEAIQEMNRAHEEVGVPAVELGSIMLRYLDAITPTEDSTDLFQFLHDYLHVDLHLPEGLFSDGADRAPRGLVWRSEFSVPQLQSRAILGLSTGKHHDKPAVVLETIALSDEGKAPGQGLEEIRAWLDGAHSLLQRWFMSLIEGALYERFSSG
jgi:uncharacterized protein (TIGR04255 family)